MTAGRDDPDPGKRDGPAGIAIVGPTASGKSALAMEVAGRLGGEIVSMDSRQVYRGMDIGTAKPDAADRARIPHHGLDLVEPGERYSAGRFARDARRWIAEIRARGRLPVLAGGTGFFLKALQEPIFREPGMDPERRERLRSFLRRLDRGELARWAGVLDPARAALAVAGGPQRLLRTLEVPLLTGRSLSWWHRHAPPEGAPLELAVVVLEMESTVLAERIRDRTAVMLRDGLVEEVGRLLEAGVEVTAPGMTGTGYREVVSHLRGERTLEETAAAIEAATRSYARRQRTWFRNQAPPEALRLDATLPVAVLVERVEELWRTTASRGGSHDGGGERG